MFGIDNLKKAVKLGVDLGLQADKSFEDGAQLTDFLSFVPVLMQVPGVVNAKGEIAQEAKDVDPDELAALQKYAIELGVPEGKTAEIVQNSIGLVLSVIGLIVALKAPTQGGEATE